MWLLIARQIRSHGFRLLQMATYLLNIFARKKNICKISQLSKSANGPKRLYIAQNVTLKLGGGGCFGRSREWHFVAFSGQKCGIWGEFRSGNAVSDIDKGTCHLKKCVTWK